jgi:uncharacterized protein (TIGR00369 family)
LQGGGLGHLSLLNLFDRLSLYGQAECVNQTQQIPTRNRSYAWQDPAAALTELPRTDGLELLQRMAGGSLPEPPIAATLGFEELTISPRQVSVSLTPAEHHLNPLGTVHGGVLAALLDTACGCAIHTTLDAGTGYTSLDLVTRFLRPVTIATGQIRCEGEVLTRGSRTATAQARIVDSAGRLLAHATSTCLLFPVDAPAS